MKFKVTNWSSHEAGLPRRGSLTLWVSDEAIAAWTAAPRKTPGGQARYSATAIETALIVRLVFHQPLRQTEGPIDTVMADGAYDGEPTYQTSAERDPATTVIIPPRSTAVPGPGANPKQRDRHIQSLADKGRLGW